MPSCVPHSQHVQLTLLPAGDGDSLRERAWPQCLFLSRSRTSSMFPTELLRNLRGERYTSRPARSGVHMYSSYVVLGVAWNLLYSNDIDTTTRTNQS